jgi:hypothetical protein
MSADGFTVRTPDGRTLRFEPAALDVEIVDVWPPGRLSQAAKDAYDALASAGRIRPVRVDRDGAGRVYVRYMADIPEQWIREELREAKYRGRQMEME